MHARPAKKLHASRSVAFIQQKVQVDAHLGDGDALDEVDREEVGLWAIRLPEVARGGREKRLDTAGWFASAHGPRSEAGDLAEPVTAGIVVCSRRRVNKRRLLLEAELQRRELVVLGSRDMGSSSVTESGSTSSTISCSVFGSMVEGPLGETGRLDMLLNILGLRMKSPLNTVRLLASVSAINMTRSYRNLINLLTAGRSNQDFSINYIEGLAECPSHRR